MSYLRQWVSCSILLLVTSEASHAQSNMEQVDMRIRSNGASIAMPMNLLQVEGEFLACSFGWSRGEKAGYGYLTGAGIVIRVPRAQPWVAGRVSVIETEDGGIRAIVRVLPDTNLSAWVKDSGFGPNTSPRAPA